MNKNSTITSVLTWLIILISMALTLFGLRQQVWPDCIPWNSVVATWPVIFLLVFIPLLVMLLQRQFHLNFVVSGLGLMLVFSVLSGNFTAVAFVLCFILTAIITGEMLAKWLGINVSIINISTSFLMGAGAYATFIGLMAHFAINYIGVYQILLILPLLIYYKKVLEIAHLSFSWQQNKHSQKTPIDFIGAILIAIVILHFLVALLPELGYDALAFHLLVPVHMAVQHYWGFDPSLYVMALMPMLGEWLYSMGYMIAGEAGARLLNLLFTFLLAYQGYQIAQWLGATKNGAKATALLFLSTPLVFAETSSLFVDAIWAAFMVSGIMAMFYGSFDTPLMDNVNSYWKIGGLMLGFAVAAKAVTLLVLPLLALLTFFNGRNFYNRYRLKSIFIASSLFLLVGCIPYITAWFISGNPVLPLFNAFFKSPYYRIINFNNPLFVSGISWDLLYRITFNSSAYLEAENGASGFQCLLLLPAITLFLLVQQQRKPLVFLFFIVAAWLLEFYFQSYLRYVYPFFLLLSVLIGATIWPEKKLVNKPYKLLKIIFWFSVGLNIVFFPSATWMYRSIPLTALFNDDYRQKFLNEKLPIRLAVNAVNAVNVDHSPVVFFTNQPYGAGLNTDALYVSWYNFRYLDRVVSIHSQQDLVDLFLENNTSYIILDDDWDVDFIDHAVPGMIKNITKEIASFNKISVRELLDQYRFGKELLKNPTFLNMEGWNVDAKIKHNPDRSLIVRGPSAVTQVVSVIAGKKYKAEVTACCPLQSTQVRTQVNWLNNEHAFISTSIDVFNCDKEWQTHQSIIKAPDKAVYGVVYGASHTALPVQIKKISLT